MAEVEEALKRTLAEVEAIKSQIQVIVSALVANKEITEVDLGPLLDSRKDTLGNGKPSSLTSRLSLRGKSKFRGGRETLSQSALQPSRPAPFFAPALELVEEETFLIPVLDRWIWGTTVINKSVSPTTLPFLHLFVPSEGKLNATSVFTYSYTATLVDMGGADCEHAGFGIPFQGTFESSHGKDDELLKPGCKALLTAYFSDPVSMYNSKGFLRILVALFSDGKFQLSRTLDIKTEHAFTRFNDATYKRFRSQIFSALSQDCQESFKLERIRPAANPLPALKSLLNAIGFETVSTVKLDNDITVECLAYDVPSLLFGMFVKIQSSSRENPICCSIGARSPSQMKSFARLFAKWVRKESGSDRMSGLKLSNLHPPTSEDLTNALLKEIEVLTHLVIFMQHNTLDSDAATRNWLHVFQEAMANTDRLFMHKMRVKS